MKGAGYIRLSSDDSGTNSLITQREMIIDYCKQHNIDLIKIYDEGIEKSTDWHRPLFNQLKEDIKQQRVEVVVCKDQSRLARDQSLLINFIKDCKAMNVKVISIETNTDLAENELLTGIFSAVNFEVIKKGKYNQEMMMFKKMKDGKPFGTCPYGYTWNDKKEWVINGKEIVLLKKVFNSFLAGKSTKIIAQETGVYRQKVERILTNKIYTGIFEFNIRRRGAENKVLRVEKHEYQLVNFKPVISLEDHYNIIQKIHNKQPLNKDNVSQPLIEV